MTINLSKIFQIKISVFVPLLLFTLTLCSVVLLTNNFVAPSAIAQAPNSTQPAPTVQSSTPSPQQLFQQGITFYQNGQFAEAATVLQQAARTFQSQRQDLKQAAALSNLALTYQQLGLWTESQAAIAASLSLLENKQNREAERQTILAQTLDIQGGIQLAIGQPETALQTWQQATALYTQLQDTEGVIRSRLNQARALQITGFYRRALDILTELNQRLQPQPESLTKAATLRSLGDALQLTGDLDTSRQVLQESLKIAQRLQSAEDISAAQLSLGNTARVQQETQAAIDFYQQAAASAPDRLAAMQAEINRLSLLSTPAQQTTAIELIEQIQPQLLQLSASRASIYARINFAQTVITLSKTWQQAQTASIIKPAANLLATAIQQAKDLRDRPAEADALGLLGNLYEQVGQFTKAQQLTEQALVLSQAINAPQISYRWQWQLGRLLQAQGKLLPAKAAYEAAIADLKSLRNDLVAVNRDVQFNFRDSVEPIYRQAVALLLEIEQTQPDEANLKRVRELVEDLQLAELDNFFREACINAQTVILDQVVDRDNPTTAVIYPIILDQKLQVIAKIPQQKLRNHTIAINQPDLENLLKQLRRSLVTPDAAKEAQKLAQQVYSWLIQPIESDLNQSGVTTLVFVLDGAFRNVPMSALYDGKQYLIEKYAVALNLGLQLLKPTATEPTSGLSALVAGLVEPPPDFRDRYSSLPEIKTELALIQQAGVKMQTLLEQAFNSKSLSQAVRSLPFNVVHLATHGRFSSRANDTYILAADGPIYVDKFDTLLRDRGQTRSDPIELLVLSACQTAEGDNRATLGLAGVAIRAGARSTLASLWQVNDRSTALLMGEFYRELAISKVTKAEALRRAQRSLLDKFSDNPEYSRPLHWAAYVLVGNWL
jgi:CHAT domain-containing protein